MQNTVLPNPKYPMFYIFDPGQKRLSPWSKRFSTWVEKLEGWDVFIRNTYPYQLKYYYLLSGNRRGTKGKLPFVRVRIVRINRIFNYFSNLLCTKIQIKSMYCSVFHTKRCQYVE